MKNIILFLFLLPLCLSAQSPVTTRVISTDTIGQVTCRFTSSARNHDGYTAHYVQFMWNQKPPFAVVQVSNQSALDSLVADLQNGFQLFGTTTKTEYVRKDYSIAHAANNPDQLSFCAKHYMGCVELGKEELTEMIAWLKTIKFP